MLRVALMLLLAGQPATGRIVHYGPSWDWERIAALNGVAPAPAGYVPVAVPDCGALGRFGWLAVAGEIVRIYVADCTAAEDLDLVLRRGIIAEMPYQEASRLGFLADGWIRGQLWLLDDEIARGTTWEPTAVAAMPKGGQGSAQWTFGRICWN